MARESVLIVRGEREGGGREGEGRRFFIVIAVTYMCMPLPMQDSTMTSSLAVVRCHTSYKGGMVDTESSLPRSAIILCGQATFTAWRARRWTGRPHGLLFPYCAWCGEAPIIPEIVPASLQNSKCVPVFIVECTSYYSPPFAGGATTLSTLHTRKITLVNYAHKQVCVCYVYFTTYALNGQNRR